MPCPMCHALDDDDGDLSSEFDQNAVMELATAITRTGSAEAAMYLNAVFRDQPEIMEWIEQARYSRAARLVPA